MIRIPTLFRSLVVVALMVAGSGLASITTQGVADAAAPGPPITVGVICTCSGPFGADILGAEETYQAWANTVNKAGGINGHKIELIVKDDAANPGTSVSEVETLIADHVDAIADMSILDQAWASTVQAAHIPVVGVNETETPFYTFSDFYPEGQTNDSVTYANVVTAKEAGAKNLGDFYCAEAASCQQGVPLIEAAGKKLGVPVVYNASISATAPNYTAQCVEAEQRHVSAVFIGDAAEVIAHVATNCSQQSYTPIYVTEGEGFGLAMAVAPGLKDKLWSEYSTLPFFAKTAPIKAMDAAVDTYYPGLRDNQNEWSQLTAEAWASGLLLKDALKGLVKGATPSAAAVVKGLLSLKGDTLSGMAPPLTFKAGKDHLVDCWFTGRVVNGVPKVVDGGRLTCEK